MTLLLRKNVPENKTCFDICTYFVWKIFRTNKTWARYHYKRTKVEISLQTYKGRDIIINVQSLRYHYKRTKVEISLQTYNGLRLEYPLFLSDFNGTWTIKARDARRITAAGMKNMRRSAGYTSTDYKTNGQIAKGVENNTNFGQITVIQEKLDTTCKYT